MIEVFHESEKPGQISYRKFDLFKNGSVLDRSIFKRPQIGYLRGRLPPDQSLIRQGPELAQARTWSRPGQNGQK